MVYVFIVQRSEPGTFDYKGNPISQLAERVCCSSAAKAWKVLSEMIKKFPPYLPKVEADRVHYLYKLRTDGEYILEAQHSSSSISARWVVSVSKEEVI